MTDDTPDDDPLEVELRDTLRTIGDSYEPRDVAPVRAPRRRFAPLLVAAALALVVAVGFALVRSSDDAADLDVRDSTTTESPPATVPATTTTVREARPLGEWTWRVGAHAPIAPRTGHEVGWTGSELLVWGGADGSGDLDDAAAYDPESDVWRIIDLPDPATGRLLPDPPPPFPDELHGIVTGPIDATPPEQGGPAPWILTTADGTLVEVPRIPDRYLRGFRGAQAAWTGQVLVVWGGRYDCGPGGDCALFGPDEPFIFVPPPDHPVLVVPPTHEGEPVALDTLIGSSWVLRTVEVDDSMLDLGDVRATFEIEQSGPEPFPLPLTAHGTAGCEYRAGLISLEPGSVGWTSRPEPCEPTSSAGARVFLDRLAETHTATVVVEWPAEFLILEGDSLRFVLART